MNRPKRLGTLTAAKKRKLSLKVDMNSDDSEFPNKEKHFSCNDLKHLDFMNYLDNEANNQRRSSKNLKLVQLALTKKPTLKNSSNNIFKKVYNRKKSRILNPFFASKTEDNNSAGRVLDMKRFKFQNMKTIRKEFFIDLVASSIKSLNLKKSHFVNNDAVKRALIDEIIKPIDGAVKKPAAKHKHRQAIKNPDTFLSSIRNLISSYTVEKEPQQADDSKRDINVPFNYNIFRKSFFVSNSTMASQSSLSLIILVMNHLLTPARTSPSER